MRHDSAENSSNVASNECDHQLLRFAALGSGLWNNVFIKCLYSALEACEFHHGVWNLSTPKRDDAFVEPARKFLSCYCSKMEETKCTERRTHANAQLQVEMALVA